MKLETSISWGGDGSVAPTRSCKTSAYSIFNLIANKMSIITDYSLVFQNKIADFGIHGKRIHKIFNSNNSTLLEFFNDWTNPDDITKLLLPDINDVLNGIATLRENGSETISIDIEPNVVTFYIKNVGFNRPQIPSCDFLQIAIAWRDFLLQPPVEGTPV
jgi:hypothetical protein